MFCFIFLLGHNILGTELLAELYMLRDLRFSQRCCWNL